MNRGMHAHGTGLVRIMAVLAALVLGLGLGALPGGARLSAPPPPAAFGIDGAPGTIYYGATPPGASGKPVLVFVHGKNGEARGWWTESGYYGRNDMYDYAYNYGYRTAFVDLLDSNGGGASMWANGQLLRTQLDAIATHYGVGSMNVIAHSKGGVDTQAAIVHYGAGPRVQKLFTLGTPHWGTPTADLAYSNWAWWIAALLGELNDGTYVMRTGYMNYFRSITDNRAENNSTRYYTGAGTSWGPLFSALWWGGSYLSFYGTNDGLVPTNNARNPRGTHVFTRNLDHDSIRLGRTVFSTLDPTVRSLWRGDEGLETPLAPEPSNPTAHMPAGSIMRGGPLAGGVGAIAEVPVEEGATHLTLDVLSDGRYLDVIWTAPDGERYIGKARAGGGTEYFRQAYHYTLDLEAPAAGTWRVSLRNRAAEATAYLLVADITSSITVALDRPAALTFAAGSDLGITVRVGAGDRLLTGLEVQELGPLGTLDRKARPMTLRPSRGEAYGTLPLPDTAGVVPLSLIITGRLSDGTTFERDIATSVALVMSGAPPPTH